MEMNSGHEVMSNTKQKREEAFQDADEPLPKSAHGASQRRKKKLTAVDYWLKGHGLRRVPISSLELLFSSSPDMYFSRRPPYNPGRLNCTLKGVERWSRSQKGSGRWFAESVWPAWSWFVEIRGAVQSRQSFPTGRMSMPIPAWLSVRMAKLWRQEMWTLR